MRFAILRSCDFASNLHENKRGNRGIKERPSLAGKRYISTGGMSVEDCKKKNGRYKRTMPNNHARYSNLQNKLQHTFPAVERREREYRVNNFPKGSHTRRKKQAIRNARPKSRTEKVSLPVIVHRLTIKYCQLLKSKSNNNSSTVAPKLVQAPGA